VVEKIQAETMLCKHITPGDWRKTFVNKRADDSDGKNRGELLAKLNISPQDEKSQKWGTFQN